MPVKRLRRAEIVARRPRPPSAAQIERKLEAPGARSAPQTLATRDRCANSSGGRNCAAAAPSIDIQSINFAFGSAEIPYSQYGKVENIATAMERMLQRRSRVRSFLIEGHTDAVGSDYSNQMHFREARAASLKRMLVREFGIPRRALGDGRLRRGLSARANAK